MSCFGLGFCCRCHSLVLEFVTSYLLLIFSWYQPHGFCFVDFPSASILPLVEIFYRFDLSCSFFRYQLSASFRFVSRSESIFIQESDFVCSLVSKKWSLLVSVCLLCSFFWYQLSAAFRFISRSGPMLIHDSSCGCIVLLRTRFVD